MTIRPTGQCMHPWTRKNVATFLLLAMAAGSGLVLFLQDPISQPPGYHLFRDTRTIMGIPHFFNVVTNVPFIIIGMLGVYKAGFAKTLITVPGMGSAYTLFFAAVFLIGPASIHYHLSPDNTALFWDRLPMSVAFMSLFALVLGEFVSLHLGRVLLLPLILTGILSVIYWLFTETSGQGDLRLYAWVQFYPLFALPVILVFFSSRCTRSAGYWQLLGAYGLAKMAEHFDAAIYAFSGFLSGHSLKHLLSACGVYLLLVSWEKGRCQKMTTN